MGRSIDLILEDLYKGNPNIVNDESTAINSAVQKFLCSQEQPDIEEMRKIILISNILYNNSNERPPLEDGVYDLLVVKYNNLTGGKSPVGAPPIQFELKEETVLEKKEDKLLEIATRVQGKEDMLFYDALVTNSNPIPSDFEYKEDNTLIAKRVANSAHNYPELVGTLNKCKFTLNAQAAERGLLSGDSADTVIVFERDFLHAHVNLGINATELIAELKYDGVSIEAQVDGDTIVSAGSRGDTDNNEAADLTPIFGGYVFNRASNYVPKGTIFGIKFEAIITYENLQRIKAKYGKSYANPRNAVIGLLSGLDSRKFRDYITLVPLACSKELNMPNREVEIKFLNKYYSSGVDLRYQVLQGDYTTLLFLVKRFVEEAEYMRSFLPFMYDGVVVSYTDPAIINYLGRKRSVNQYSTAIKFNALKKQTIFKGYTFSIGQNGLVTPLAHFNPVEFMGGIHDKTTAHSLSRFKKLTLRVGDIVDIELVNDVICYITKPENSHNDSNPNPIVEFPTHCPSCGQDLYQSDSGNSAMCLNFRCPERNVGRMTNMLKKLNIKDFSTQTVRALDIYSLTDLITLNTQTAMDTFGEVVGAKLMERIEQIKNLNYPDYRIIGSLGFSSIAAEKWKKIMCNIKLDTLINGSDEKIRGILGPIKGIGPVVVDCVIKERHLFMRDLVTISKLPNIQYTYGEIKQLPIVRFTGVRDEKLEEVLRIHKFDADGNKSVTKQTDILIVPYQGFKSSKTSKVGPNCRIMTLDEVWKEIPKYFH